jgi:hypothetical protein
MERNVSDDKRYPTQRTDERIATTSAGANLTNSEFTTQQKQP